MPNAVLQKMSKTTRVSLTLIERFWREAAEEAEKTFGTPIDDHGYAYVVSVVRKRALEAKKG